MVGLLLRDEISQDAWRVWPDPETVPPGRVEETGSYLFELHDAPGGADAALLIDDTELEGLGRSAERSHAGAGLRVFMPAWQRPSSGFPVNL